MCTYSMYSVNHPYRSAVVCTSIFSILSRQVLKQTRNDNAIWRKTKTATGTAQRIHVVAPLSTSRFGAMTDIGRGSLVPFSASTIRLFFPAKRVIKFWMQIQDQVSLPAFLSNCQLTSHAQHGHTPPDTPTPSNQAEEYRE